VQVGRTAKQGWQAKDFFAQMVRVISFWLSLQPALTEKVLKFKEKTK
jgi:hypothetical protein